MTFSRQTQKRLTSFTELTQKESFAWSYCRIIFGFSLDNGYVQTSNHHFHKVTTEVDKNNKKHVMRMQCVGIGISKFHQDTNRAACWHPFGPVSIWFSLTQKMRGRPHTSISVYMISCAFKYAYTIHFKLCYLHTWMFISVGWKGAEHSGAPVNQRVPTLPNQESILLPEQQISPQRTRHHRCFGPNQFVVEIQTC